MSRPRLTDQMPLGTGPLPRLVLVCAPAGFGKTTLLSQWLVQWRGAKHDGSRRVAWLSLDAEDSDPHQTIRRWLRGLPDDVVRRHPVVNVIAAWSRLSYGDVDDADARLREAEETLDTVPREEWTASDELRQLPMTIATFRAAVAQARGDVAETARQARRVLDLAGPTDHLARGGGAGFLGLALWAAGELDAAVETFSEAVHSLHAAGNLADELGTTVVLAGMWLALGRPAESERLYELALATARQRPDVSLPVTGDLHVGLADALVERGRPRCCRRAPADRPGPRRHRLTPGEPAPLVHRHGQAPAGLRRSRRHGRPPRGGGGALSTWLLP
jgi:ATP/maltotriose-dependent transcriptional regulator MalT